MEPVSLLHQGRQYSASWRVIGGYVAVFHHQSTKRATIGSLPPALLAKQLLFELVARDGLGTPDPLAPGSSADTQP